MLDLSVLQGGELARHPPPRGGWAYIDAPPTRGGDAGVATGVDLGCVYMKHTKTKK